MAARLKHQEELRHRSGPEAPHSHRAAAEAARLRGLGQAEAEEEHKVCHWQWRVCEGVLAAQRHAWTSWRCCQLVAYQRERVGTMLCAGQAQGAGWGLDIQGAGTG